MQAQISLLLKESGQGLHCLQFHLHLLDALLRCKTNLLQNDQGVYIRYSIFFRILTEADARKRPQLLRASRQPFNTLYYFSIKLQYLLPFKLPKMKLDEFANSTDPYEVAYKELSHLDLHCLHSSLRILNMILHGKNIFF